MKKYLLICLLAMMTGCAGPKYYPYHLTMKRFVIQDNVIAHNVKGETGFVKDTVLLALKRGDSLSTTGYLITMWPVESYELAELRGRKYYIKYDDLGGKCKLQFKDISDELIVPKEKAETAWARAVVFVNKNSGMKMQTQSDYVIQTYTPFGNTTRYGYTVTKEPDNDKVKFKVEVSSNGLYDYDKIDMLEKQCIYYMMYGEECH